MPLTPTPQNPPETKPINVLTSKEFVDSNNGSVLTPKSFIKSIGKRSNIVPLFDPGSMSVDQKLMIANQQNNLYLDLISSDKAMGLLNYVSANFLEFSNYQGQMINTEEIIKLATKYIGDIKATIYINYYITPTEAKTKTKYIYGQNSILPQLFNPNWRIVPFFNIDALGDFVNFNKDNVTYGIQLIGCRVNTEINDENIDLTYKAGFREFCFVYSHSKFDIDIVDVTSQELVQVYEYATAYPDINIVVYALNYQQIQNLPNNVKVVVGKDFWDQF
jgi:hypothetical protein